MTSKTRTPTEVKVEEEGALLHRDGDTPVVVITQEDMTDMEENNNNNNKKKKDSPPRKTKSKDDWTNDQSVQTPETIIVPPSGARHSTLSPGTAMTTDEESASSQPSSSSNRKALPPRTRPKSPRQQQEQQQVSTMNTAGGDANTSSLADVVAEGRNTADGKSSTFPSSSSGSPLRVRRRATVDDVEEPEEGPNTQSTVAYESTPPSHTRHSSGKDRDGGDGKKYHQQPSMETLENPSPRGKQQQQQSSSKVLQSPPYTPETPVVQSSSYDYQYSSNNQYTTDDDDAATTGGEAALTTPAVTPIQRGTPRVPAGEGGVTPQHHNSSSKARRRIVVNSSKRSNSPDRRQQQHRPTSTTYASNRQIPKKSSSSSYSNADGDDTPVLMEHTVVSVEKELQDSGAYAPAEYPGAGGGGGNSSRYIPNGQVPLLVQASTTMGGGGGLNYYSTSSSYQEEEDEEVYDWNAPTPSFSNSHVSSTSRPGRGGRANLPPQPLQVKQVDWSTEVTHEGHSPVKRRVTSRSPEKLDVSNSYNGGRSTMLIHQEQNEERDQIILTDGMQQQLMLNPKATRARHIQYQERCDVEATMLGSWAPQQNADEAAGGGDVRNLSHATTSSPILVKSDRYRHPYVASPERDRGMNYPVGGPQLVNVGYSSKDPASTFASSDERALRPHPLYSPYEHEVGPDGAPSQRYNLRSSPTKPDFLSHQYEGY